MAFTTASRKFGSHAFFFPEGVAFTVPSAGTCSRTAKPGAADTGWIDPGVINDFKFSPAEGQEDEIYAPTPGVMRLYDVKTSKIKQKGSWVSKEVSPLALQTLLRTLALTSASTQFNPHEGVDVKGWLKAEIYDDTDTLAFVIDAYVLLKVSGDVDLGSGSLCDVTFEFTILHSTLNTGSIYPS